jgi:RNase P subunit RPR2
MIDLGSIEGLHAHEHQLAAYCPRCDAWRRLPLAEMVAQGKGSLRLPISVRCRDCGEVGRLQFRPPVPQ